MTATMATIFPDSIRRHFVAVRALLVLTVILGVAYPLAVTGVAQAAFHHNANGSQVKLHGHTVGSGLLAQSFTDSHGAPLPQWFQPAAVGR